MKTNTRSFRLKLLRRHKDLWDQNPDPSGYLITKDVLNEIRPIKKINETFETSIVNYLMQDGLLDFKSIKDTKGKDIVLSKITKKGLDFLEKYKETILTRKIAIIGLISGCFGTILSIIGLFL